MRYLDSTSRSAEYLRAALPLMQRQHTALHPVSYAVWYEFVSGTNPDLNRQVQALTQDGSRLDDAQTWALFRRYVAEPDNEATRQLNDGFSKVIENMAASAAQAGEETARLDSSLNNWVEQLLGNPAQQTQAEVLQEVLAGTREIRNVVGVLQERLDASQGEIRRLREEVQRVRTEAFVDVLTGLANRRAFEQHLSACIAAPISSVAFGSAPQQPLPCLLLGDIDFFKKINDSFGHAFGDQVLRTVAQTLKQAAAPSESLPARVGGEEFAMLLPASSLTRAEELAEQVRQKVGSGRVRRGGDTECIARVTISLGVTQMVRGESANSFFERADRALYASKREGRNCVTTLVADVLGESSEPADGAKQAVQLPDGKGRQQQRTGTLHV